MWKKKITVYQVAPEILLIGCGKPLDAFLQSEQLHTSQYTVMYVYMNCRYSVINGWFKSTIYCYLYTVPVLSFPMSS
jgi:hypothetical protein